MLPVLLLPVLLLLLLMPAAAHAAAATGSSRYQGRICQENIAQIGEQEGPIACRAAAHEVVISQAPRAEERLAAVLQPPEQRHRLGLVELSQLSTSTPIGAVVVEVQTEEELAIQVTETAEITKILFFSQKKRRKRSAPLRSPLQGCFLRFFYSFFFQQNKSHL